MSWNGALALVGATLLLLGLSSGLIKNRWHASEPLVAMLIGCAAAEWLPSWDTLHLGFDRMGLIAAAARFTLTIALVDVALGIPTDYVSRAWKAMLVMLGGVMPLMWIAAALLGWLLLGLPWLSSLLVAAVICPTDPVLAGSLINGNIAERNIPQRLRHLIGAEAGANDTLALPLVTLPLSWMTGTAHGALGGWLVHVMLLEIAGGAALGLATGWLTGKLFVWSFRQPDAERASLISVALALAIALLGALPLLHSDGVLAAFVAGLALNRALPVELTEQKALFHSTVRRFFELPIFLFFGMALPWAAWRSLGLPGIVFAALVLLLRRPPAVLLAAPLVRPIRKVADIGLVGWFGPIGIAALYYGSMATLRTGEPQIWNVTSLVVASSVLAHGLSSTALTRVYGRLARTRET
jgi:NhaP-type Na+/H+ or K+/H+ antiporter